MYLQDMTCDMGPLRVIPGSHRERLGMDSSRIRERHPKERLLGTRPGDLVCFHNNIVHSGGLNLTSRLMAFWAAVYVPSWIKQEDDFSGVNCACIAKMAAAEGDTRALRLLGIDPKVMESVRTEFLEPDETIWARTIR